MSIFTRLASRTRCGITNAWKRSTTLQIHRNQSSLSSRLVIHPEVQEALAYNLPVVALESTIISHGMSWPDNVSTALEVEQVLRDAGVTPATIAILDGKVHVGLDQEKLERLGKAGLKVHKTSRRDLPWVLATKNMGSTTVSCTMLLANLAKIPIFVTGGLGGVSRGGELTMDVSADLYELARTPVSVVCAGIKSILDIPRSLEVLETFGVPVMTLESEEFPAFYTRHSGVKSPLMVSSVQQAAEAIYTARQFKLNNGHVLAVPIPEQDEADAGMIADAIKNAVERAENKGIRGRDYTPFILDKIKEITGGVSQKVNIALIKNNAKIGAELASRIHGIKSLAMMEEPDFEDAPDGLPSAPWNPPFAKVERKSRKLSDDAKRPLIIGATVLDISAKVDLSPFDPLHTSSPGSIKYTPGGVGRNLAEIMHRLGVSPRLISAVAQDAMGRELLERLDDIGLSTEWIQVYSQGSTPVYNAVFLGDGNLLAAVADMKLLDQVSDEALEMIKKNIDKTSILTMDGNVTVETMKRIINVAKGKVPVFYEPTSVPKSVKILQALADSEADTVDYISPNYDELLAMYDAAISLGLLKPHEAKIQQVTPLHLSQIHEEIPLTSDDKMLKALISLVHLFPTIIMKKGSEGVILAQWNPLEGDHDHRGCQCCLHFESNRLRIKHFPPTRILSPQEIQTVTGAGDAMAATLIASIDRGGKDKIDDGIVCGIKAAELVMQSEFAVNEALGPAILEECECLPMEEDEYD